MDQKKTGVFIAKMRKEKGLTQSELAEALLISDKTVSKWETGKGLPEVSLMLPLCEKLGVTVNELLTGAKLSPAEYQKKAEVNIMDLMQERRAEARFRIIIELLVLAMTIFSAVTIALVLEYVPLSLGWEIALTVLMVVNLALGIIICAMLEMRKAVFECTKCGHRFMPTKGAYIMGVHSVTRRYLKCPNCGVKNWCKRCLSLENTETEEKEEEKSE